MWKKKIIKTVFRLGKIKEEKKPRPLNVVMKENCKNKEIFQTLHKIKNDKEKNIVHDFPPDQRKEREQLEEEAAAKTNEIQEKDMYCVRGHPGHGT